MAEPMIVDDEPEPAIAECDEALVSRLLELDRQLSYGKSVMSESGPATKPRLIYNRLLTAPDDAAYRIRQLSDALDKLICAVKFEVPAIRDDCDVEDRSAILLKCADEADLTRKGTSHG